MRAQAEDGQLTHNQHFRDDSLMFIALKIRAGMNAVFCGSSPPE